jgi:hypothetical protein
MPVPTLRWIWHAPRRSCVRLAAGDYDPLPGHYLARRSHRLRTSGPPHFIYPALPYSLLRASIKIMDRRHLFSRRHRLLWVGAALFCLLFQQVAMAAYVCPLPVAHVTAATDDCAAMGMGAWSSSPAHAADPRCAEHCTGHLPATSHARATAPPLLLLPLAFAVPTRAMAACKPSHTWRPGPDSHPPNPPLPLRFCSLLI